MNIRLYQPDKRNEFVQIWWIDIYDFGIKIDFNNEEKIRGDTSEVSIVIKSDTENDFSICFEILREI